MRRRDTAHAAPCALLEAQAAQAEHAARAPVRHRTVRIAASRIATPHRICVYPCAHRVYVLVY
eukprot:7015430-Alexandrium_andersonii.AAC.1